MPRIIKEEISKTLREEAPAHIETLLSAAEDAYEKIKRGASLVQMITGLIYEGPQIIGEINKGLVVRLEKDGYKNISDAIGAYYR